MKLKEISAFLCIYIIWGTTFLGISYALKGFPPFILLGLRFTTAGVLLLSWLFYKGERPVQLDTWKQNSISGVLILTMGIGSLTYAEQYITSTEAAIVAALEPFWFMLIDKKSWKYYFANKLSVLGIIIGFVGLLIFFRDSLAVQAGMDHGRTMGFMVMVFGTIVWVLGAFHSKKPTRASLLMNVSQQLFIGGVISLAIATMKGEWQIINWATIPMASWSALLYLIFFGSILAHLSFIWLLSIKPPAMVSTHTFINPIVAVLAGTLIAGEALTGGQAIGITVIVIGVAMNNLMQFKLSD
ncbi:EamA family transporter [Chitinophaga sp.]|uniref:EamA family transporter n=1 Tax=Chitinophaga sp. TaxID=1869181 RepID=UPI0031CFB061